MRHTLATQAINRGMSLEAIPALLGHHSLDMTLRYAKIANRSANGLSCRVVRGPTGVGRRAVRILGAMNSTINSELDDWRDHLPRERS